MDFNKVLIGGRLTRDPELRHTTGGTAVASLAIASNRVWTDKKTQEKREESLFVDVEFFGTQAEQVAKHFQKGRPIFIEGRLKLDQWEAQDGSKRSKIKVVGDEWRFCGDARGGRANAADGNEEHSPPPPRPASARPSSPTTPTNMGVNEEDLPF